MFLEVKPPFFISVRQIIDVNPGLSPDNAPCVGFAQTRLSNYTPLSGSGLCVRATVGHRALTGDDHVTVYYFSATRR